MISKALSSSKLLWRIFFPFSGLSCQYFEPLPTFGDLVQLSSVANGRESLKAKGWISFLPLSQGPIIIHGNCEWGQWSSEFPISWQEESICKKSWLCQVSQTPESDCIWVEWLYAPMFNKSISIGQSSLPRLRKEDAVIRERKRPQTSIMYC